MDQLEAQLVEISKGLPPLPESLRLGFVKFTPWIMTIFLILTLPLILAVLGLGALLAPLAFLGGVEAGWQYFISLAFSIVLVVIEIMAIPKLFKRMRLGWQLSFYSRLISFIHSLLLYNIIGGIIWTAVELYVLFQIRQYYPPVPAFAVKPRAPAPKPPAAPRPPAA